MLENPNAYWGDFVAKQRVVYSASVDGEGFPDIKAFLPPRKREGLREFWFSTNTSSRHVQQYLQNPQACLYFCEPASFRGLLLKGVMTVFTDAESRRALRQPGDEMYYPKGVDDPDCCVLRFVAASARCYANLAAVDFTPE